MTTVLKWIGIVAGGLLVILIVAYGAVHILSSLRFNKTYTVEVPPVTLATSAEDIAEGERLYITRACAGCHGNDGAGSVLLADAMFGTIAGPNLTTGEGGIGAELTDEDFVRADWFGVGFDGKPLIIMPAEAYHQGMHAEDLGKVLAFVRSLEPVDGAQPASKPGPLMRVFMLAELFPVLSVESMDVNQPPIAYLAPSESVEYGAYLAQTCTGCHGTAYAGTEDPISDVWPTNITPTGLADYTEADFITAMRTGIRPDRREIDTFMPWQEYSRMNDTELKALWRFLQNLEPREFADNS